MKENQLSPQYTSDTMLAYIDILGFKKLLENEPLSIIVEIIENILKVDNSSSYAEMLKIKTNLISDSFVVYAQLTEPKHLTAFFVYLGTIIGKIHRIGNIITRGFVSSGDHYSKDNLWISHTRLSGTNFYNGILNNKKNYSFHSFFGPE